MANKSAKTKPAEPKLPLKLRLKAWWEGYDEEELKKRLSDRMPVPEVEPEEDQPEEEPAAPAPSGEEIEPWDEDKININQYIWGEGFCGPGGPDYIIQLSKLMALSPEMSMVQIGAGLGGPARVLVERFGVWMTGFEDSRKLVEKGMEMSTKLGLEKKAQLSWYDPETLDAFERRYDRAMAKEALFTIENKKGIIEAVEDKLKPGGLFLITDYVLGAESTVTKDRYKEWRVGERRMPYPVMSDELTEMVKAARMQVRVSEDITQSYVEMINKAWSGADEVAAKLARQEDGTKLIQILMQEAEFWTRRKKLLESGDIKLWRIVANKKSSGPSMMSDW